MKYNTRSVLRRLAALIIAALVLFGCFGCAAESSKLMLEVWVYSEDYKDYITHMVSSQASQAEYGVNVSVVDSSSVKEKLENARVSGTGLPDIFMLSPDNLGYFTSSALTMPVKELGISLSDSDYYPYTLDLARDSSGDVRAMCFIADPGIFAYRRSMASAYLGTDSPEAIEHMISTWDGFLDTGRLIKVASEGKTRIVSGTEDVIRPYFSSSFAFVRDDGSVKLTDSVGSFLDLSRTMSEEKLTHNAQQWSQAWIAGISDTQSTFGYFVSGLGLRGILKPAAGGSDGDWAAACPPSPYNWGGVWLAAYSATEHRAECGSLLRLLTADEESMRAFSLYSGEFTASRSVNRAVMNDSQFESKFLSGQNYFELLDRAADKLSVTRARESDTLIMSLLSEYADAYSSGDYPRDEVLMALRLAIEAAVE